jgi:DNA processing protein
MTACDLCLRRGVLVAALAPRIADRLGRARAGDGAVLALPEEAMLEALAGERRAEIEQTLERSRPEFVRDQLARAATEAVCVHSDRYPLGLHQLPDPPRPLFVRGGIDRLGELVREPCVAIVGGRKPSEYGLSVAAALGRGLAAAGVTVVSGLALGIDAASHRGAMAGGGSALAVLARGPEVSYPVRHSSLYEQIVRHGAVVSELMPGTRAYKWSFPARNRIMAALAQVVVVVEAREASGSLITAELASGLNCEVAAVPGLVTARAAEGSNRLLRDGAAVIRHTEDVLELLYGVGYTPRRRPPDAELEPPLRLVLDAIETRDSLRFARERAGLSAAGFRAALGRLETLGLVRSDGLGGYERCIEAGART